MGASEGTWIRSRHGGAGWLAGWGSTEKEQQETTGRNIQISLAIVGSFRVKRYLNNTFNSFLDFSASDWYNKIPISLF